MQVFHILKSGKYEKHLRKMNRINKDAFASVLPLFDKYLNSAFEIINPDAGEHLFGWWRYSHAEYVQFREKCHEQGIVWGDPMSCFINETRQGVLFGFMHLEIAQIEEALKTMAQVFNSMMQQNINLIKIG